MSLLNGPFKIGSDEREIGKKAFSAPISINFASFLLASVSSPRAPELGFVLVSSMSSERRGR